MSAQSLDLPVARKSAKNGNQHRDRIDLRAEPALVERIQRQADRLGMSLSAYIRQAVILRLEHDEGTQQPLNRPAAPGQR